jgi:aminoglycoside/choline kinase family phosphotransferase
LQRLDLLREWLESRLQRSDFTLEPASSDASFRRYVRVTETGGRTLIAMDAPPPQEDCRPFVHVARLFHAAGVHVPEVHAEDLERGFLLLSDLGNTTYLSVLSDDSADALYREALAALARIQAASRPGELPDYDRTLLERELRLFPDWYVAHQLECTLEPADRTTLEQAFEAILAENLAQPRVYVHRDYHSRNLMVTEPNPGVLDFQDAVYGPITTTWCPFCATHTSSGRRSGCSTGAFATGSSHARPRCPCMRTSAIFTAPSNGWASSGRSRSSASLPDCGSATERAPT